MQANSDGLSPSLRPFLGLGWNRALPAPFAFGNGMSGNGTNQYMSIPGMVGKTMPAAYSIEFWVKASTLYNGTHRFLGIITPSPGYENILATTVVASNNWNLSVYGNDFNSLPTPLSIGLNHYVIVVDSGTVRYYCNGTLTFSTSYTAYTKTIGNFYIMRGNNSFSSPYFGYAFDEFRYYEKALNDTHVRLNYNSGIGENPCETEYLKIWYGFENFENLDFSTLQDGSDIMIGIRDKSGWNNHARPYNMITDPTNINYVLRPF